jgi:hypothetical protein
MLLKSRSGLRDMALVAAAAVVGFVVVAVISQPEKSLSAVSTAFSSFKIGCDIKGNVSINSSAKIYHMPGQRYYLETNIRPEFGERWFCSEAEARAAGWRRAGG